MLDGSAPGIAAGHLLGWNTTEALFLGGITYISSSGIVAKVLNDLGRLGNRETPVVLSILALLAGLWIVRSIYG